MGLGSGNHSFKLKLIDLTDDTTVTSAGGTNTQTLQPPVGKIYEIVKIWFDMPVVGGTINTHTLKGSYVNSGATLFAFFSATSDHDQNIDTYYGEFSANGTELPSGASNQYQVSHAQFNLFCNYDNPIYFYYVNDTDANQTGTRVIKVLVKESYE